MRSQLMPICIASCLALSAPAHADAGGDSALVHFSGFGTLGAVHTQGDGAAFIRDLTQPHGVTNRGLFWELDSRIGIQANFKPTENLEAVAQVVSRYRSENNFAPEITWGFLKYTVNETIEVRAGRIGFDAFLSADSRDVGYSFLWVRPPVDYYGTLMLSHEDGGDIVFRVPIGKGVSRFKLYTGLASGGVSSLQNQTEWAGNMHTGSIGSTQDLSGSRVTGGLIDYQDTHWIARLGMAQLKIAQEFPTGQMDILGMLRASSNHAYAQGDQAQGNALKSFVADASIAGKKTVFKSAALAYEDGPLQTQMALSSFSSNGLLVPDLRAGYLSAGYRLGKFTPYAVISAIRTKRSRRGDEMAGLASSTIVSLTNFMLTTPLTTQHTYTLGIRYGFTENAALKFQVDMIHNRNCSPVSLPVVGPGAPCSPPLLWQTVPVNWNGRANVYSAVLDFTF